VNEQDWIAAMEAEPACVRTMAAFSDWLQERGDPRWEPLAWLAERGKVGDPHLPCGYWCHEKGVAPQSRIEDHTWWSRAFGELPHPLAHSPVPMRLALMSTYSRD